MSERVERLTRPEMAIGVCVLVSAGLLAGAHLFERVGQLPPCLLCLDQREAHWAVLGAGVATFLANRAFGRSTRILAAALGAVTLLYLFSTGLAGYHAGVEWGFWPGPDACAASANPSIGSANDLLASLEEAAPGPSCSEAAWRMFGLSMAGYNALISLAMAGFAVVSCRRIALGLRDDRVTSHAMAE